MTLQTDEKLTQNAKAIEKKKMERKRQEEIEKQRKVSEPKKIASHLILHIIRNDLQYSVMSTFILVPL